MIQQGSDPTRLTLDEDGLEAMFFTGQVQVALDNRIERRIRLHAQKHGLVEKEREDTDWLFDETSETHHRKVTVKFGAA